MDRRRRHAAAEPRGFIEVASVTRQPHSRAGHDRWLVSYADLVTLLLALFTTLYAASTLDARKADPIASSFREAIHAQSVGAAPDSSGADLYGPRAGKPAIVPPVEVVVRLKAFEDLKARLARELEDAVQEQRLEIAIDGRGLVLSLPEQATFPVGTADVTPAARELITRLADKVAALPNLIRVEGHTDDVPIRTPRFASNWELSTARASAVVALLIGSVGIDPARLSAAGYGQFHPRVPNSSPENRARNRRIDLVVMEAPAADVVSGFSRTAQAPE
jgi:chemotaxis protein MotB